MEENGDEKEAEAAEEANGDSTGTIKELVENFVILSDKFNRKIFYS